MSRFFFTIVSKYTIIIHIDTYIRNGNIYEYQSGGRRMDQNYVNDFYASWTRGTALYVKWAADHGISYTELSVLYALVTKGPATQKYISENYGLPKQTVNHCIRHFENEKYLRLEAGKYDKREKRVILTEEGEHFAKNLLDPLFEIEAYLCRNISPDKFIQAIETRELFNTLFEKAVKKENTI